MRRATFPSGMVATTEDAGPRSAEAWPTWPIGAVHPVALPVPRPFQAPPPPPVQPFEEEDGLPSLDACMRPRDAEDARGGRTGVRRKGRHVTAEEVPPYALVRPCPWARSASPLG